MTMHLHITSASMVHILMHHLKPVFLTHLGSLVVGLLLSCTCKVSSNYIAPFLEHCYVCLQVVDEQKLVIDTSYISSISVTYLTFVYLICLSYLLICLFLVFCSKRHLAMAFSISSKPAYRTSRRPSDRLWTKKELLSEFERKCSVSGFDDFAIVENMLNRAGCSLSVSFLRINILHYSYTDHQHQIHAECYRHIRK